MNALELSYLLYSSDHSTLQVDLRERFSWLSLVLQSQTLFVTLTLTLINNHTYPQPDALISSAQTMDHSQSVQSRV